MISKNLCPIYIGIKNKGNKHKRIQEQRENNEQRKSVLAVKGLSTIPRYKTARFLKTLHARFYGQVREIYYKYYSCTMSFSLTF